MPVNAPYRFDLIDPRTTIRGEELLDIFDTWSAVERWWRQPKSRSELLIGYISYEQGYDFMKLPRRALVRQTRPDIVQLPKVYFGRFRRSCKLPTQPQAVVHAPLRQMTKTITAQAYKKLFKTVQRHLAIGDIYQANLAYRLLAYAPSSTPDYFWKMFKTQPVPYGALIQTPQFTIASNSPELFLRMRGNTIETRPMKGTRRRGHTPKRDRAQKNDLWSSVKERAELDMVIDVHRNDLAHTSRPGSIIVQRRRELVALATVWQAQARITALRQRGYTPLDTITGCFPAGSVTGAPKLRAMEIIHSLETVPRQVYCGAIGYIAANGDAEFNVAIRTAILSQQKLYYYSGSGITTASTVTAEWQELLNKQAALIGL